ncbi:hypothetical protein Ahy_A06g026638 [Arachis hypogaea]|uniref:VQ domain-containing protein n=1 Tax=Arachis hypogaea TaxID=3818 RepID=A0A445CL65_ARAHY|nr:hypothetical protein Ahy_A06g026638 [Arachis hypogaea]
MESKLRKVDSNENEICTEAQNFRELVQRITGKPPTTTHENCCNIQKKPPTISSSEVVFCGGGYLGGFSDLEQSFISELPMFPFDI